MSVCPHCVAGVCAGAAASVPVIKYVVLPKLRSLLGKKEKADGQAQEAR